LTREFRDCGAVDEVPSCVVARSKTARPGERLDFSARRFERTFDERLSKIDSRLANIETLVLEEEKVRKFDAL